MNHVDYHHVESDQQSIHVRLINWGMWNNQNGGQTVSPMFRQAKSNAWQWHLPEHRPNCDMLDAWKVEQLMRKLTRRERDSVVWCYVTRSKPIHACRLLGVSHQRLYDLVCSARKNLQKILDTVETSDINIAIAREYA